MFRVSFRVMRVDRPFRHSGNTIQAHHTKRHETQTPFLTAAWLVPLTLNQRFLKCVRHRVVIRFIKVYSFDIFVSALPMFLLISHNFCLFLCGSGSPKALRSRFEYS
jgi:hypothetical protein